MEVVPIDRRAFTSGVASEDQHAFTVEVCNTSGAPDWGISQEAHERLAVLAYDLWREGHLGSLTRQHIIGHREVPGTYATACPGPSMDLDWIAARARQLASPQPTRRNSMTTNYVKASTGDKKGGAGSLWATAGDAGSPCPGNWIEFTRTPADGGMWDRGSRMAANHGNAIMLTDPEWEAFKLGYTTPPAIGKIEVGSKATDLTPATISALAQAIAKASLDAEAARLKE